MRFKALLQKFGLMICNQDKKVMKERKQTKGNLLIIRDTFTNDSIIGKLYLNSEFISHTLELPWKDNARSVSCIPKGVYDCRTRTAKESGSRDYLHLLVKDVPNRTYILFHYGNSPSDSRGCILTGMMRADEPDKILHSRKAHHLLMDKIIAQDMSEQLELVIKNN